MIRHWDRCIVEWEARCCVGVVYGLLGAVIVAIILLDVFETIVLPRRVERRFHLTSLFYRAIWRPWRAIALHSPDGLRQGMLGWFGPLSLLVLLAVWGVVLICGFALLIFGWGGRLVSGQAANGFGTYLYMSGTTFFTLGLGDVAPVSGQARLFVVAEVATGFSMLALVIGYLPVLYQAFSRREVNVTLLDARAGSPPTAGELLRRFGSAKDAEAVSIFLRDWERWTAELMEGHLSYPVLAYYRSQHEYQSWLAALTTILDVSALIICGVDGVPDRNARLAFATGRHAVADLARVFGQEPVPPAVDRLPAPEYHRMRAWLARAGVILRDDEEARRRLNHLRAMYEPYVLALSHYLVLPAPAFYSEAKVQEYWRVVGDIGGRNT